MALNLNYIKLIPTSSHIGWHHTENVQNINHLEMIHLLHNTFLCEMLFIMQRALPVTSLRNEPVKETLNSHYAKAPDCHPS